MKFVSNLRKDLEDFVSFKRSLGYKYNQLEYLSLFDQYCFENGNSAILSKELVRGFIEQYEGRVYSDHHYFSNIRDFGKFLVSAGKTDSYILPDIYSVKRGKPSHYIMTEAEVTSFFEHFTGHVLKTGRPCYFQSVYTYFSLLYACGCRTFEARMLLVCDVHLKEGYIDVMRSKGIRDRRIYLSEEVRDLLISYDCEIRKYYPQRTYFFSKTAENAFSAGEMNRCFKKVWLAAGLPLSHGNAPSPYSFRHYFAYTNLRRWMSEKKDANVMITYLMRAMGHSSIRSTMYYLASSPDFFMQYGDRIQNIEEQRLPEVIPYEE